MSCYWHIQCIDCDERMHFDNANHADEAMWAIIEVAPLLTDLPSGFTLSHDGLQGGRIDVAWLAEHREHRLVPVDEYGRLATQCHGYWECGECEAQHHCKKSLEHEGAHGKA